MKAIHCQPEPIELADLYLADPELTYTDVSLDLIDFAAGRNTVCRPQHFRRCQSEPSPSSRTAALRGVNTVTALPPPRPFRRSRTDRPARNDTAAGGSPLAHLQTRNNMMQLILEQEFDEDLFTFLLASQSVS